MKISLYFYPDAKPGTSKSKRGRGKKSKKQARTSTPTKQAEAKADLNISMDSELAEFRDLEGAIEAILDSHDYDSFDDDIFSDCDGKWF